MNDHPHRDQEAAQWEPPGTPTGRRAVRPDQRRLRRTPQRPGGTVALRRISLGLLGLIGGVLAGVVVQDLLAPLLVTGIGEVSRVGLILLPLLIPGCGVAGAVLAVLLDRRASR